MELHKLICEQCKIVLWLPKKRFWGGKRKYCSNKCDRLSKAKFFEFKCKNCGIVQILKWSEFNFGRGAVRQFCSVKCRHEYKGGVRSGGRREGPWWEKHKDDICLICNRRRADIKSVNYWFSCGMCLSCRRLLEVCYLGSLDLLEITRLRKKLVELIKKEEAMPWPLRTPQN